MFIQVIRGKAKDPQALRAASEKWARELKPGAKGYLGVTEGIADDGTYVAVVRFESEDAARSNSDRPEQGKWWDEASKALTDVTFYDCPTVDVIASGGSDKAGFVQVMVYETGNVAELRNLGKEFEKLTSFRPDVIGGTSAIARDGKTVIDTNYFTSEKEAREGEAKQMPPDVQSVMDRFGELTSDVEFIDLRTPRMDSA